eukprot:5978254-Pyramimonas_sp.AAC.1
MKTLLGSVDGSIMLDRFWEKFDAGPLHLQWFLDEACTKPSIVPSPRNRPISETVVEEYKCRILNSGLSTGTRGEPWFHYSSKDIWSQTKPSPTTHQVILVWTRRAEGGGGAALRVKTGVSLRRGMWVVWFGDAAAGA